MNQLYDLREWFHECDRFLFLAEVHYHKEDVVPSEHKFSHELTSSCLERMFHRLSELKDHGCIRHFDIMGFNAELSFLKDVLDKISAGRWDEIDPAAVTKAQEIVHELADAVNADILENNEDRGHPRIYNACRIR